MAVIVPNAANASPGQRFEVISQAEPDSLDFEILGNIGRSGVVTGCEVTAGTGNNVIVSAGTVVINGVPYDYAGGSSLLPAAPIGASDKRYDIVVARLSGGSVSINFVRGAEDDVNFSYPPSRSVLASDTSYDPATVVDLGNEVVLAAVYRANSLSTIRSHIVDKRATVLSSVVEQGTAAPSSGSGDVGDLFFRTTSSGPTGSGLFVRRSDAWLELSSEPQASSGPYVPIGGMVAWPARVGVPTGYVEANGQSLSVSAYAELYAVYADTHGENVGSGTFNVPNLNNRVPRGTTSLSSVGTNVGADSVSLTVNQLPPHNHGLNGHTHTLLHSHPIDHSHSSTIGTAPSHTHGMNHTHTASSNTAGLHAHVLTHSHTGTAQTAGAHQHTGTTDPTNPAHNHSVGAGMSLTDNESFMTRIGPGNNYKSSSESDTATTSSGYFRFFSNDSGNIQAGWRGHTNTSGSVTPSHSHTFTAATAGAHSHTLSVDQFTGTSDLAGEHSHIITVNTFSGDTALGGDHTHTLSVNAFVGASGDASNSVTSAATGNTADTGNNDAVPIIPAASLVRWIIRAK